MEEVEGKTRLAYAIRRAMQEREITQKQLAAMIHRNEITVGRWTRGQAVPSALDILPLSQALRVSPEYFINPLPVPEMPAYPIHEYLLDNEERDAAEEGKRRAARRQEEPPAP